MSEPNLTRSEQSQPGDLDAHSVLFAQMVIQQSNLAMMLMGKVPNPESGQPMRDLEAARLFIDQLEMLEIKTKGNLSKEESALLKQSLMTLRMAFVEAAEAEPVPAQHPPEPSAPPDQRAPASEPAEPATQAPEPEEGPRKKFSKKY